ncbi:hypothetical protein BC833DRAFT_617469 [Globomyces pollinis-pini]|nr:hypothetical protein BC833DRAFT_617469 [Globomyces pollinis-pini]
MSSLELTVTPNKHYLSNETVLFEVPYGQNGGQIDYFSLQMNLRFLAIVLCAHAAVVKEKEIKVKKPKPSTIGIKAIDYAGTGCPTNSVSIAVTEDKAAFTVIFDNFVIASGPGIPEEQTRKECQIKVKVSREPGYSYSFEQIDFRGYVNVPLGVKAIHVSKYHVKELEPIVSKQVFQGPTTEDYLISNVVNPNDRIWSSCDDKFVSKIKSDIRLEGDLSQPAQLTVDSLDGKVKQTYRLVWKSC